MRNCDGKKMCADDDSVLNKEGQIFRRVTSKLCFSFNLGLLGSNCLRHTAAESRVEQK